MRSAIAQFQDLLIAEESVDSLDRAMNLVSRIASADGATNSHRWFRLPNSRLPARRSAEANTATAQWVKSVLWALSKVRAKIAANLKRLPDEQYSILLDSLLLVFHHAYFALLPRLSTERTELLQTFKQFADALRRPQDQFQVRGLVAVEQGDYAAAANCFRTALAATHADEHDFITRVQMVWTVLMEHGLYSEAFECLIDIYPRTSRSDIGEVAALLRQTFRERAKPSLQKADAVPALKHG